MELQAIPGPPGPSGVNLRQPHTSFVQGGSPIEFGESAKKRLTGPIQFVLKLLEFWRLELPHAAALLGFTEAEGAHVTAVLEGRDRFLGRDVNDRIAHLFRIRESLDSLFRDLEAENKWLREPQALLDGRSPLSLLLDGSMEDVLLTREYVDAAAGR